MRVSAALVLLAIALFGLQLGFSDGALPHIAALPIGMIPITSGVLALILGLIWGLIIGNGHYRAAIGLAILGTAGRRRSGPPSSQRPRAMRTRQRGAMAET